MKSSAALVVAIIAVIHAGEGTLWTDLKNASIALPQQKKAEK